MGFLAISLNFLLKRKTSSKICPLKKYVHCLWSCNYVVKCLHLLAIGKIRSCVGMANVQISAEDRMKISELWAYMSHCSHLYLPLVCLTGDDGYICQLSGKSQVRV